MTQNQPAKVKTPDPVDIHVGSRVRLRRTLMGLSQEKLADALGITFQQVQKYENGANRMGASRLFRIGQVLETSVSFFFEGAAEKAGFQPQAVAENKAVLEDSKLSSRETVELIRSYYGIEDSAVRKKVLDMIKSLGKD